MGVINKDLLFVISWPEPCLMKYTCPLITANVEAINWWHCYLGGLRQGAQELMRKSARRTGIAKLCTANLRTEISHSSKTLPNTSSILVEHLVSFITQILWLWFIWYCLLYNHLSFGNNPFILPHTQINHIHVAWNFDGVKRSKRQKDQI